MPHRRGELRSPVKSIYTKSGRTQFAPTKYIVFLWVVKTGRRGNRPLRKYIQIVIKPKCHTVGENCVLPHNRSVEGAGVRWTPLRQQKHRPNRQVRPPLSTKYHLGFNVPRRAGVYSCRMPNRRFTPTLKKECRGRHSLQNNIKV